MFKALQDAVDRFLLQCPGLAARAFDLVGYEPVVVGAKVDPADVRPLNDVLRYSAPAAGGYDPPQAEGLVLRTGQKAWTSFFVTRWLGS